MLFHFEFCYSKNKVNNKEEREGTLTTRFQILLNSTPTFTLVTASVFLGSKLKDKTQSLQSLVHVYKPENYFGTLLIADTCSDFLALYFSPTLLTTNCRQEWGLLVITSERLYSLLYYWALLCMCKLAN